MHKPSSALSDGSLMGMSYEEFELNTFFKLINRFVRVTLKYKDTITQSHLAQIRKLGKQIGLKFGVKDLDAKFINSKDFVAILKSKIFCLMNSLLMRETPLETPKTKQ